MRTPTHMLAWTMLVLALTTSQSLAQSTFEPYTFTTLAGNAGYGSTDGTGSAARFNLPSGVAVDSAGNVYVADAANHTIRKVTSAGVVTTLAGLAGRRRGSALRVVLLLDVPRTDPPAWRLTAQATSMWRIQATIRFEK